MGISGIYAITNLENGKVYIGSTVDFNGRWDRHRDDLCCDQHHNIYLQRSWNKHGENSFEFGVLEYVGNPDEIVKVEQFWIDLYREKGKDLYNIALVAGAPMLGRKHSEKTRKQMSVSHRNMSPEMRARFSRTGEDNSFYGKKHTEKSRLKMSKSHTGKTLSEEHKYNISQGVLNMDSEAKAERSRKISKANLGKQHALGYRHTEEAKQRIGEAQKGNKHALGCKRSKETKRRMSEAAKRRPPMSEETKRKISEARKAYWARKSYVLDCT